MHGRGRANVSVLAKRRGNARKSTARIATTVLSMLARTRRVRDVLRRGHDVVVTWHGSLEQHADAVGAHMVRPPGPLECNEAAVGPASRLRPRLRRRACARQDPDGDQDTGDGAEVVRGYGEGRQRGKEHDL